VVYILMLSLLKFSNLLVYDIVFGGLLKLVVLRGYLFFLVLRLILWRILLEILGRVLRLSLVAEPLCEQLGTENKFLVLSF
jgi:hypothetical protein